MAVLVIAGGPVEAVEGCEAGTGLGQAEEEDAGCWGPGVVVRLSEWVMRSASVAATMPSAQLNLFFVMDKRMNTWNEECMQ